MQNQTLGIDIDGTISEFYSFLPYLNELLEKNVTPEQLIQYDLHEIFGMEYNAFCSMFDEHSIPIYRGSIPRNCAQTELQVLDRQFKIVYITARLPQFQKVTHEWILSHGFPDREIICTGSHDKLEAIKTQKVNFMVEDRLENALEIWHELNVPVFLLDTPYNQGELPNGITRVNNWYQIKEMLFKNK